IQLNKENKIQKVFKITYLLKIIKQSLLRWNADEVALSKKLAHNQCFVYKMVDTRIDPRGEFDADINIKNGYHNIFLEFLHCLCIELKNKTKNNEFSGVIFQPRMILVSMESESIKKKLNDDGLFDDQTNLDLSTDDYVLLSDYEQSKQDKSRL
ncbi:hypothetical protein DERP_011121, partial [Dermatophagoides pteronyssinus]